MTPPTIDNFSFESPPLAPSQYEANPAGSSWLWRGSAGITGPVSAFTANNYAHAIYPPNGSQVAFFQGNGSSASQVLDFPEGGTFQITMILAQRFDLTLNRQDITISIDGVAITTITPPSDQFTTYTTPTFSATAGTHTLIFNGNNTAGGDNTVFLDDVTITQVTSSSMTLSPAMAPADKILTITATFDTAPAAGTTLTLSGGTGAALTAQSLNGRVVTCTLNPGTGAGTLIIADPAGSGAATFVVTAPGSATVSNSVVPDAVAAQIVLSLADANAARQLLAAFDSLGQRQASPRAIELLRLLLPGASIPSLLLPDPPPLTISSRTKDVLGEALGDRSTARDIVDSIVSGGLTLPTARSIQVFRSIFV